MLLRFQSGFERNLVGQTLDFVRPVLLYTMDTELTYDKPIKELQFGGYQIFRYKMFFIQFVLFDIQILVSLCVVENVSNWNLVQKYAF